MKRSLLALLFIILIVALPARAQRPIPPGIREADKIDAQTQQNMPPPANPHRTIDLDKLRHDANELASLAQSVPPDIDQTTKGVLPKDLTDKLKRIEKLAKQLRSQITP